MPGSGLWQKARARTAAAEMMNKRPATYQRCLARTLSLALSLALAPTSVTSFHATAPFGGRLARGLAIARHGGSIVPRHLRSETSHQHHRQRQHQRRSVVRASSALAELIGDKDRLERMENMGVPQQVAVAASQVPRTTTPRPTNLRSHRTALPIEHDHHPATRPPCHCATAPPRHRAIAPPRHRATAPPRRSTARRLTHPPSHPQYLLACSSLDDELWERKQSSDDALMAILKRCAEVAPELIENENQLLPLTRLAAWVPEEVWVRPLDEWDGSATEAAKAAAKAGSENEPYETTAGGTVDMLRDAFFGTPKPMEAGSKAKVISLISHLIEKWTDVPSVLREALFLEDGPPITENAQRISFAFLKVYTGAGTGSNSVKNTLQAEVSPAITKTMAKIFVEMGLPTLKEGGEGEEEAAGDSKKGKDGGDGKDGKAGLKAREGMVSSAKTNPLHALRVAQAKAFNGAPFVLDAVCNAKMGQRIGSESEEAFNMMAIQWACTHQDELEEPSTVTIALNYLCEMHQIDKKYSTNGRTPKSVQEAMEAYELTTTVFSDDELFQPNPESISGYFKMNTTIPEKTSVYVPYDGETILGGPGEPGHEACSIRIQEIDSLKRLIFEGEQLGNCLKDRYSSQVKYVSRVRQRASSYWSMTIIRPDGEVEYLCLIEIWHLRRGNVVHQAEGPRPRTIPTPEAWYWLDKWCKAEDLNLAEWNCYS